MPLHLLGEIARASGAPEAEPAETHYRQALVLAEELGMRPLVAHCHLGLGTLYAEVGRQDEARAELSTAIDLYRAMEMTFWLPQAEASTGTGGRTMIMEERCPTASRPLAGTLRRA